MPDHGTGTTPSGSLFPFRIWIGRFVIDVHRNGPSWRRRYGLRRNP